MANTYNTVRTIGVALKDAELQEWMQYLQANDGELLIDTANQDDRNLMAFWNMEGSEVAIEVRVEHVKLCEGGVEFYGHSTSDPDDELYPYWGEYALLGQMSSLFNALNL